jgi:Ca2+-binding RTX toxin-like protein
VTRSQTLLETLEGRRLLSASVTGNGTLKIVGSEDAANTIHVACNDSTTQYDVTINGETESFDAADVRRLRISGGEEADTITVANSAKVRAYINGNGGDDVLTAGSKRTAINGGDGNDSITGSAKTDTLRGGAGNDTIAAGAGDDRINGDDGDDILSGDAGDNEIGGGGGADTITALDGDDVIIGGDGEDSIDAGTGDDDITEDSLELEDGDCGFGGEFVGDFAGGPRHHFGGRHGPRGETIDDTTDDSTTTTTTARSVFGALRIR